MKRLTSFHNTCMCYLCKEAKRIYHVSEPVPVIEQEVKQETKEVKQETKEDLTIPAHKYRCACGSTINISGKIKHGTTIKHKQYMESLNK